MVFYSHPDKTLVKHLSEVRDYCRSVLDEDLQHYGDIISACHDFGKYTTYFQDYLFKEGKKEGLSNHGFISAVFGAFIAFKNSGEEAYLPLVVYNTILHHHGSLENVGNDLPSSLRGIKEGEDYFLIEKIGDGKKQIEDMQKNKAYILKDYTELGLSNYLEDFLKEEAIIENTLMKLKKLEVIYDRRNKTNDTYFLHQMLYSALIAGDKISASNTLIPSIKIASFETLEEAKNRKFKGSSGELNKIRNDIFREVQREVEKYYKSSRLFSITSPTGTGKTITGFFAALKLRKLLGDNRKIIYSLPFTSIIDQGAESIDSLLMAEEDYIDNSSRYMIKHHNLSNVDYKSEEENYDKASAEILIENWSSGIIITTFVQLLQTLIGARNRMLKKFHSLKGAIILLDEVQAIDIKYYRLVDYILKSAAEKLDLRIIMMTATRPLMLQESVELLTSNRDYFEFFNRTELKPMLNPITVEDFLQKFIENIEDKSYLIICDTIGQSLKIYDELRNIDREVMYLSTNILPIYRRQRIDFIKERLSKGEKFIVVSTQVVEAGVDFDFDEVLRDIAPVDSIIQAAGRCNRNGEREVPGKVRIYSMINDKGELFGSQVYGKSIINISRSLLKNYDIISESMYFEFIERYFNEVNKKINDDASDKFIKAIEKLYFSDFKGEDKYSINKFSLIKNNPDYVDIYFRIDDKAEEIYQKLLKSIAEKNFKKKRELYLEIKNSIRDYTLSVPIKFLKGYDKKDIIMNYTEAECEAHYDMNIGFKREANDEGYLIF